MVGDVTIKKTTIDTVVKEGFSEEMRCDLKFEY